MRRASPRILPCTVTADPDTAAAPRRASAGNSNAPGSPATMPGTAGWTLRCGLLLLALAALWFGLLGQRSLIHSDEGRYATLALGILQMVSIMA